MYRSPFSDSFMSSFMNDPFFNDPFFTSPFMASPLMASPLMESPFMGSPFARPQQARAPHSHPQTALPAVRIEEIVEEGNDESEEEQGGYIVEDPDGEFTYPHTTTQRRPHVQHQHQYQQYHQHHQQQQQQSNRRFPQSDVALFDPFSMMREMMQGFGSGFPPTPSFPSRMGPGGYFSSSSTTYSSSGNGVQYSKTSTTRVGNNGLLETQETERHSGTGVEKMSIHRQLGERARTVTRQKNHNEGGAEQCHQTFNNITPEDASNFDVEWIRAAEQQNFVPNRIGSSSGSQHHSRPMLSATPYDRPATGRTPAELSSVDSGINAPYGYSAAPRATHVHNNTNRSRPIPHNAPPAHSHNPSSRSQDHIARSRAQDLPRITPITEPIPSSSTARVPRVDTTNLRSQEQQGPRVTHISDPYRSQDLGSRSQDFSARPTRTTGSSSERYNYTNNAYGPGSSTDRYSRGY